MELHTEPCLLAHPCFHYILRSDKHTHAHIDIQLVLLVEIIFLSQLTLVNINELKILILLLKLFVMPLEMNCEVSVSYVLQIGLRWRTEKEVISGKGIPFIFSSLRFHVQGST